MKSITPDSKKFINQILIKNPNEDKINESILYSIKRKQQILILIKEKVI